jgi:hypothetical protein
MLASTILFAYNGSALACSPCLCGDPTLTTMGAEKPFAGRQRISLEVLDREERIGVAGVNKRVISEMRTTLGYSYWLDEKLALGVRVPLVDKQLSDANLAQQEASALGDIDIDARLYLWQDRPGVPRHIAGVQLGLRLTTANQEKSSGVVLDNDVQPGDGLTLASIGVWHGYFRFPWMVYSSSQVNFGLDQGYDDFDYGGSLKLSSTLQYALNYKFALQIGVDMRWSEQDSYNEVSDPDSGGFIAFLAPGAVVTLAQDLILNVKIQSPWIEDLDGDHEEDTALQLGVTYDF